MNFVELQDRLNFVLNSDDSQTHQDFSAVRKKQALNYAGRTETNKAQVEGSRLWFKTTIDISWPASQTTLQLSSTISQRGIIRITDITNTNPGYELVFSENGFSGDVFWLNRTTLQWGTSGPSEAKTLRVEYFPIWSDLAQDDDEPELIPEQHQDLLIWSAAIFLFEVAEQEAPIAWHNIRHELRIDFWKYLSRGRPMSDVPTVRHRMDEVGFTY